MVENNAQIFKMPNVLYWFVVTLIIEYFTYFVNRFAHYFQNKGGETTKGSIMIYDNIHKRAKVVGITINALEKKAEVSTGSISKWNTVSPSVRSLKKVADILNCSVDELLREEDV